MKKKRLFQFISLVLLSVHLQATETRAPSSSLLKNQIEKMINQTPECKKLGDFYWEFGSASATLESGSVGTTYSQNSVFKIASASKWFFGAYAAEVLAGKFNVDQKSKLQMLSGFTNLKNLICSTTSVTVNQCNNGQGPLGLMKSSSFVATDKNRFVYGGGHAQSLAVDPRVGLANETAKTLGPTLGKKLGLSNLTYSFPQLAGGAMTSPATYAQFLQNLMNKKYILSQFLKTEPGVCANKNFCGGAKIDSPAPDNLNWWYGLHYWIEKSNTGQVEAFSSPGLYGFYPWISADLKYYGLIARKDETPIINKAYVESALCGKALRDEFLKNVGK